LVEAAWRVLRSKSPETAALRAWALAIARRRGKRIAAVALAVKVGPTYKILPRAPAAVSATFSATC